MRIDNAELNESWKLLQALKDKEKFNALSVEDKLEALRLHTIQTIHNKEQ